MNERLTVTEKTTLWVAAAVVVVIAVLSWRIHQASLADITNSDYGFWPPLPATEAADVVVSEPAVVSP